MNDPRSQKVERQIAALGGSIAVSSDRLRQRVLDQATDSNWVDRGRKRTAQVFVTMAAAMLLLSPAVAIAMRWQVPKSPDTQQVNQAALRHADRDKMTFDWALVDVFQALRGREQAP